MAGGIQKYSGVGAVTVTAMVITVFSLIGLMLVLTGAILDACSFVSGLAVIFLGFFLVAGLVTYGVGAALSRRGKKLRKLDDGLKSK